MSKPIDELREVLEARRRLFLQEVNLVLRKYGHTYMTDREEDQIGRSWADTAAQALSVLRERESRRGSDASR